MRKIKLGLAKIIFPSSRLSWKMENTTPFPNTRRHFSRGQGFRQTNRLLVLGMDAAPFSLSDSFSIDFREGRGPAPGKVWLLRCSSSVGASLTGSALPSG